MINYAVLNYILWLIAIGGTCTIIIYAFIFLAALITEVKK